MIKELKSQEISYKLLYLADEDDDQIAKYLSQSKCWGFFVDGKITGQLALKEIDSDTSEIVNVAVFPEYENRKIATRLVEQAIAFSKEKNYKTILIKTGNCGIKQIQLYQRCGFRMDHIVRDYMIEHYSDPIYENSVRCRDQVVLNYRIYSPEEQKQAIEKYWNSFIAENPQYSGKTYESWSFGLGDSMTNQLIGLVQMGQKRGTSSALAMYGPDEAIPKAGDLSVILYGDGLPGCIIETVEVVEKKFCEIGEEEARLEGEGDLSLDFWQKNHRHFFTLEFDEMGMTFKEDITVLFERFEVRFNKEGRL